MNLSLLATQTVRNKLKNYPDLLDTKSGFHIGASELAGFIADVMIKLNHEVSIDMSLVLFSQQKSNALISI